jgi:hypothetical protein
MRRECAVSPERRVVLAGGLVAVLAAILLGSVAIPAPHDGGDNATYLSLAHSLVSGRGYTELWDPQVPPHTKYPPVFPLALAALITLGVTTWSGFKLFMALAVGGAAVFAFAWASRRSGPVAGAAVAVLVLLSGGWLQVSRWVLSEPLFLLLTFAALWAMERSTARSEEARLGGATRADVSRWELLAGALAILAFFTRSAGLPLVLALLGALLIARRFRTAVVLGGAFLVPGVAWFLRARRGGQGAYQSEFWMVDPYQPALGNVGWLDLPGRAWANAQTYVGVVLPGEWWPSVTGAWALVLGVVLVGLAVWGWSRRILDRPGAAELFVPLYVGLILVWPEVWAGDRFTLPLYPLGVLYAGEALAVAGRRVGSEAAFALLAVAFLGLAAPTIPRWLSLSEEGRTCRRVAGDADPVVCHRPGFQEFRVAAEWAGVNLPEGSVVLNRKPSLFYIFGGPPGRIFPFTVEPGPVLAEADRLGARYLVLDHVDGISPFYLGEVIRAYPGAFCHVAGWGVEGGMLGTDLFGIRAPEDRLPGLAAEQLTTCPDGYRKAPDVPIPGSSPDIQRLLPSIDRMPERATPVAPPDSL